LGGAAALLVLLATVLVDWRSRVQVWRAEPDRLLERPRGHRLAYVVVVGLSGLVGLGGVLFVWGVLVPVAVALAGLAVLGVGHRVRSNGLGELGLVLAGEAVVIASLSWLPASPAGGLLGAGLAGLWMLWLARFWAQQLASGLPWTTAGRLIPSARRLGQGVVGVTLAFAGAWSLRSGGEAAGAWWVMLLAAVVVLGHGSLLIRDAGQTGSRAGALAGCVAIVLGMMPLAAVLGLAGLTVPPALLLAFAGLMLVVRVGSQRASAPTSWVYNAYVGGLLPAGVAYCVALGPRMPAWVVGLTVLVCTGAVLLRWAVFVREDGVVATGDRVVR
jgi:hypothetical protein